MNHYSSDSLKKALEFARQIPKPKRKVVSAEKKDEKKEKQEVDEPRQQLSELDLLELQHKEDQKMVNKLKQEMGKRLGNSSHSPL